jgi:hypothetical protein
MEAGPFSLPPEEAPLQIRSTKRQKEQARQQHQKDKVAKRAERKKQKGERPTRGPDDVDPDIAGIVPGPQPPLEEMNDEGRGEPGSPS